MNNSRVGTRGSRLAIAQTEMALCTLRTRTSFDFEVVTISTRGDVDKRPIFSIDEKGVFEKEINQAVISGQVDFAVHSLKDIPSDLSHKLVVASIPKRARPNDVLVNKRKLKLGDLPTGGIVGTSSLRRAIQLFRIRPDLQVKPIRGNVDTGCRFPVGAIAISKARQSTFTLYASIFSPDGKKNIKLKKSGNTRHPAAVGAELADLLVKKGARELATGWRNAVEDWNKKL